MGEAKRIVAAGTVTIRSTATGAPEILMVHRPRYDDWSLPKGKLEVGEYLPVCAVRETAEESSTKSRLGLPVGELTYPVGGGTKAVSYWVGHHLRDREHRPNSEVDQIGWFSVTQSLRQTSYPDEREIIRRAVDLPATTAVIFLRHAKAMLRADWGHADHGRPITGRGQRQAEALTSLLSAYGIERLVSSAAVRCMLTLTPFSDKRKTPIEPVSALTEESARKDPKAAAKVVRRLTAEAVASGRPTVICGHRPVLPTMLATLGITQESLPPAAALVAHLGSSGDVVAVELHTPTV